MLEIIKCCLLILVFTAFAHASARTSVAQQHDPVAVAGETPAAPPPPGRSTLLLDPVIVVGGRDRAAALPGSGAFIDTEQIRDQSYDDVHRILQRVPGVYSRGEDGFGLFPNISLRGVDPGRSGKVTLMEDGVLTAPAPYSAPAAYYSPSAGRMSGLEVLKGSSQIQYGPHTTGGVLNYLSTPIPDKRTFYGKALYGSFNDVMTHTYYGDTFDVGGGRLGLVLEGFFRHNDGFKRIDETPDFQDGDDTGFIKSEPLLKVSWEPGTDWHQRLELKLGYTHLDADETYLGLSEADFRTDPFRRYSASRFDNITTNHFRSYLRHVLEPSPEFRLSTTLYYNYFERNWFKIRRVNDGIQNVGLSQALAADGIALQVLKGNAPGRLDYRNNDRTYYLGGIESIAAFAFETGSLRHELNAGVRLHADRARRFQLDESFFQDGEGRITGSLLGPPGGGGNRKEEARATAAFVQDRISFGPLTITPGVRFEHIRYGYTDFDTTGQPDLVVESGQKRLNVAAAGVGLKYSVTNDVIVFGGIHRGYSVPAPRAFVRDGIKEETSISYEIGARYFNDAHAFSGELTFFYTDFDNLLVQDNIGAGGLGVSENVGEVIAKGIELAMNYDPGAAYHLPFRLPSRLAFTYTDARLDGPAESTDPESIFSGGQDGNRVPYVPEYQIFFGTGLEIKRFGIYLDVTYVPSVFTSASNTTQQIDAAGNPDARFGKTDAYAFLDLSMHYHVMGNAKLFTGVKNMLDREYLYSRHPEGPRPGAARMFYGGLEVQF